MHVWLSRLGLPMDRSVAVMAAAMSEEFEKQAAAPGLLSRVGRALTKTPEATAWTGRGAGALGGAALGAGLGAAGAPEGERGKRALVGALTGGALGLGGGQFATQAGRQQAKRFGQRQLHSVTGYMPGHGIFGRGVSKLPEAERGAARMKALRDMRMTGSGWRAEEAKKLRGLGGKDNIARADELEAAATPATLEKAKELATKRIDEGFLAKRLTKDNPEMREKLINLKARFMYAPREAAETGATSIPGIVRGLTVGPAGGQGRMATLRGGAMGAGGLGLGIGAVTGVAGAPEAIKGTGAYEGLTPAQRMGRWGGETAGWTLGSALPIVGSIGLGTIGGTAGQYLGRGGEAAGKSAVGFVRRGMGKQ